MKHCLRILVILFFCALLAFAWRSAAVALVRGPYLQSVAPESLTLVCKTGASASLTLRYGQRTGPPWQGEANSAAGTTHVFALSGLRPETRYAYELSAGGVALASGPACAFRTPPPAESRAPFRFLAWGDSGLGNQAQRDVAAQMLRVFPAAEFALGLGDLVYDSGAAADYDPKLFTPYATLFKSTVFWPTIGNHDAKTNNGAPYLDAFYLPTQTGASGHPSNTERYYSFDQGMAHFACVDSETSSSTPGGAMYTWLEDDLDQARARGKRWLIVFMHHPPYTRGTHDSTSEADLLALHANLVPLFEAEGVDLVLSGHSHVYERSFLARNDAILQAHVSEYTKIGSPDGTVYLVSGCGGESGTGPLDHPLMARSHGNVNGFNLFDVTYEELRGRFVERDGRTTDLFTLRKATDTRAPRVRAVAARSASELTLAFDEPLRAGTGAGGAEDPAHYTLSPSGAVLAAALDSDKSTLRLTTSSLAANRCYTLGVHGVGDPAGHSGDQLLRFARPSGGGTPTAVIAAAVRTANAPARLCFSGADSSDAGGPLALWSWDFGDGAGQLTGATVEHVYTSAGLYTVTLLVRDLDGLEAVAEAEVRIHEQGNAPQAALDVAATDVQPGASVAFDARASRDPDGGALSFHWDFGDPTSGTLDLSSAATPAHTYATAGSYVATLVVTDDEGSSAADEVTITAALGTAPTALFAAQASGLDPLRIVFSDRSSGDIDSWSWDFGDGASSSEPEPEHLYAAEGRYTVRLTVLGPNGSDAFEDEIAVSVSSGGGGGGGCSVAPDEGQPLGGDPLLPLMLALALLALARPRRAQHVTLRGG